MYFTQNRKLTRQFKNIQELLMQRSVTAFSKVHRTLVLDIGRLVLQTGVLRVWTVSAMCFGSAFRNSRLTIVIASCTGSLYINSVCIGNSILEIDFHEHTGTDHCLCVQVLTGDPNEIYTVAATSTRDT